MSLKFAEPPKVVSLQLKNYFPKNQTTEGGESKVKSFCKAYLRTKPPKVVSLKFVEPLKGGESKISKSHLRTEPPKLVSLKLVNLPKNRTTEGGESKYRTTENGELKISKTSLRTEPPKVMSQELEI